MNVVTVNECKDIVDRLNIDIIKRIDGQYELNELLSKFVNLYFNKMIIDMTSIINYTDINNIKKLAASVDPARCILLLPDDVTSNDSVFLSNLVTCGFYNFTRNFEGVNFLYNTPNNYENVKHLVMSEEDINREVEKRNSIEALEKAAVSEGRKIIGLENITNHAGASSLTNMMVRQLTNAGYKAYGIEMFRQDLMFYHNELLSSCINKQDLENKIRSLSDADVIIIDSNEFGELANMCDEIIYLIEPSYIRLTKAMKKNRNVFVEHKNDKVVLNMSFVNDQNIADFQYETGLKIFDNIPPVNDRDKDIEEINEFLEKLGFTVNKM